MITDNQAREAIKSIAEYCKQHTAEECECGNCGLHRWCYIGRIDRVPEGWAEYMEVQA